MPRQKRVVAIHDISGFGKCSLTVALPVLSAAGIETVAMPTAVLSTHTGDFKGYTYRDLTGDMPAIAAHWKSLGLEFDAIYSGYLGSIEQIDIVKKFIKDFRKDGCFALVDPAMADNGKMYVNFNLDFAKKMKELCAVADIIVPNMTEAAFMLDKKYIKGPHTHDYIKSMLKGLAGLGPEKVVLTGVTLKKGCLGAAAYDKEKDEIHFAFSDEIEGNYHGTGDVFASALVAALMHNKTLGEAAQIAVDFTFGSIKRTKDAASDVHYGVNFEEGLGDLINMVK